MKALTLKQPWANSIAYGGKHTENRAWPAPTKHHGSRILIHAGVAFDPMGRFIIGKDAISSWPDVRGAILAIATLTGSHQAEHGCCAPWGEPNVWHWQLTDVLPLDQPLPCRGALGFWNPNPAVQHAVTTALQTTTA